MPMDLVKEKSLEGKEEELNYGEKPIKGSAPGWLEDVWWRVRMHLHALWLAYKVYGNLSKVFRLLRGFDTFNRKFAGSNGRRKLLVKNGKAWMDLYIPPFPSENYDRFLISEMNRYVSHGLPVNAYQQVNFAITSKCPLRCEHCFEWDNLHLPEVFSLEELREIANKLQAMGMAQISLTGGEPMQRFEDMKALIREGSRSSEWWILTSGHALDQRKAKELKASGATGVLVSLDHYAPELHNHFRGVKEAFRFARHAVRSANEAGLMVALSVCVTKENANWDFLTAYMKLAYEWRVDFVQWLEPKQEGKYKNMDVLLGPAHIQALEEAFLTFNHSGKFRSHPLVIYHGYYQRRIGCLSAGRSSFYIDSRGMVHSCPFCHSGDFHVKDWLLEGKASGADIQECKDYPIIPLEY